MGFENYDKFMKQANELIQLKSDLRKLVEDMSRYMKQGKGKTQKLTTEHWKYRVEKLLEGE